MESERIALARYAYEKGRIKRSLLWGLPGIMLAAMALQRGLGVYALFALAGSLCALAMMWRGQQWKQGVVPGTLAGALTALVPIALACGPMCSMECQTQCTSMTALAGGVGGLMLTRAHGWKATLSGLLIATLMATSGCLAVGMGGLVGVGAVALVSLPVAALRPTFARA